MAISALNNRNLKSLSSTEDINFLVRELSLDKPNVQLLKSKTDKLGIPYNSDLIILMSEVLVYLSKNEKKIPKMKEKSL